MGIKITKMQGCGNDFVIMDYDDYKQGIEEKRWENMSEAAKTLCDRNFGVGADGFIIPNTNVDETDIGRYGRSPYNWSNKFKMGIRTRKSN